MPAATTKGVPYMLDTDPLSDVAAAIQALAVAVDNGIGAALVKRGSLTTAITNGSGQTLVPHGLGTTPTWGNVRPIGSSLYNIYVMSFTSTNIVIIVRDNAGALVVGDAIPVMFEASA